MRRSAGSRSPNVRRRSRRRRPRALPMPSNLPKILQKIRVFSGFFIAVVYMVFARPEPLTLSIGLAIALVGVMLRAWARGHLRKSEKLDVSGPYAHTRNPLYLG